jgi:hypothetical protein
MVVFNTISVTPDRLEGDAIWWDRVSFQGFGISGNILLFSESPIKKTKK